MIELPDLKKTGLTETEWRQLQRLIEAVRELQAARTAQQATLDNHETRIAALEP